LVNVVSLGRSQVHEKSRRRILTPLR